MSKTQTINTIRYNATTILSESRASTATINNYDYLLNLAKRMLAIEEAIYQIDLVSPFGIRNEPVANIVANSIHRTMVALVPSYGLGDFDWDGIGEDLAIIVGNAAYILEACDEDGMAQGVCDRYNQFITMCEIQTRLDEQWLTDLAND